MQRIAGTPIFRLMGGAAARPIARHAAGYFFPLRGSHRPPATPAASEMRLTPHVQSIFKRNDNCIEALLFCLQFRKSLKDVHWTRPCCLDFKFKIYVKTKNFGAPVKRAESRKFFCTIDYLWEIVCESKLFFKLKVAVFASLGSRGSKRLLFYLSPEPPGTPRPFRFSSNCVPHDSIDRETSRRHESRHRPPQLWV